ncbi:MAG: hypothetical protein ACW96X_06415, partial [Promethearchaeota archaeon]
MKKTIKNQKKYAIVLIVVILLFSLTFLQIYGFACNNGPNYWGNGYPGYPPPSTKLRYSHPH